MIIDFSPEFNAAWKAVSEAQSAAREATINEMRGHLPLALDVRLTLEWTDDPDTGGRLWLAEMARLVDGVAFWIAGEDSETDHTDTLDELCAHLAETYSDAETHFIRSEYSPYQFYLDITHAPLEGNTA